MLERARAEAPNVDDVHAMLTAAYARAGRMDAAGIAAAEAVRVSPNLCVEVYRVIFTPLRSDHDRAKILDAMIAGGLPRWPYGFDAGSDERLSAAEVRNLAFGRTWQGRIEGGGAAMEQIQPNGELAFRTTTYMVTGDAFVVGDMLCERGEALSLGRPICGPVYRRSEVVRGGRPRLHLRQCLEGLPLLAGRVALPQLKPSCSILAFTSGQFASALASHSSRAGPSSSST